ncbi:hypothetical protein J6R97_01245 [bacterium]|nr:hypothetical protein [bacterium]
MNDGFYSGFSTYEYTKISPNRRSLADYWKQHLGGIIGFEQGNFNIECSMRGNPITLFY